MTQEEKMTNPRWTNARSWVMWVGMVTLALAFAASLVLNQDPVAAQSAASEQYVEKGPSATSATASPSASGEPQSDPHGSTTASPSASENSPYGTGDADSMGGSTGGNDGLSQGSVTNVEQREAPGGPNGVSSSGAPGDNSGRGGEGRDPAASVLETSSAAASPSPTEPTEPSSSAPAPLTFPNIFNGKADSPASSVPKAAVEGLRSGLKELHEALNSLVDEMMASLPFVGAQPKAKTNTTAPPSATQNAGGEDFNPAQQALPHDAASGGSGDGKVPSEAVEPTSVPPSGGQVPSDNTPQTSDPNTPDDFPPTGCTDPSVLTPAQAFKCTMQSGEVNRNPGVSPDIAPWAR